MNAASTWIMSACCLLGLSAIAKAEGQSDFFAKVSEEWRVLQSLDESEQAFDYVTKIKLKTKSGKAEPLRIGQVKRAERSLLLTDDINGTRSLTARNQDYEFRIGRKGEGGWVLGSAGPVGKHSKRPSQFFAGPNNMYLHPLSSIAGLDPAQLTNDGEFALESRKQTDQSLLAVVAVLRPRGAPASKSTDTRCELVLDPTNHFCVRSVEMRSDNMTVKSMRETAEINGRLACTKLTYTILDPSGRVMNDMESEFSGHSTTVKAAADEFHLTHYGLPEPKGAPPPPVNRSWAMPAGVSAAILGVAALILWQRTARAKNT